MYERFFNLKKKPFDLVPNPDFLYLSRSHKRALTYLDYGVKEMAGFILLIGEIGVGKTTLIRDLLKKMNGKMTHASIFNTKVNSEQLISMINDDFGLEIKGKNKVLLLKELNDFLIGQYAGGYRSVLLIDEAQNLTPDLLEEIRMLSNLETDNSKLLQIILVGQPELRKVLSLPELRQLRQRISISCHINPLTRTETEEYILHRLEVAGNREAARFPDGVFDIIHDFSRGIPRLINIICDFLMLSAYVDETRELTVEMVKEIVDEMEMANGYWNDDIPDDYISPKAHHLKDIFDRIERLEEEVFNNLITRAGKAEIFEKLSEAERRIKTAVTTSQTDIIVLGGKLKEILEEMKSLKRMNSKPRKKSLNIEMEKNGALGKT